MRGRIAEGEMSRLPSGRRREVGGGSWWFWAGSAVRSVCCWSCCSAFVRAERALVGFVGSEEENSFMSASSSASAACSRVGWDVEEEEGVGDGRPKIRRRCSSVRAIELSFWFVLEGCASVGEGFLAESPVLEDHSQPIVRCGGRNVAEQGPELTDFRVFATASRDAGSKSWRHHRTSPLACTRSSSTNFRRLPHQPIDASHSSSHRISL